MIRNLSRFALLQHLRRETEYTKALLNVVWYLRFPRKAGRIKAKRILDQAHNDYRSGLITSDGLVSNWVRLGLI